MSDYELRNLERQYQASESDEDLAQYNNMRRHLDLELVRKNHFLREWAYQIAERCPEKLLADEESPSDGWLPGEGIITFDGALKHQGFNILVKIELTQDFDSDEVIHHYGGLDILNIALRTASWPGSARSWVRTGSSRSPACHLKVSCQGNELHFAEQLSILRSDADEPQILWKTEAEKHLANSFISSEEFFSYLLTNYISCLSYFWSNLKKQPIKNEKDFIDYLQMAQQLNRNIFKKRNPILESVFKSDWFQIKVNNFSKKVEKFFDSQGLYFDMESRWPVEFISHDGYELKIRTGYNDTVEEVDSGESVDEDLGEKRGYVYDVANEFSSILEDYDSKNKVTDGKSWEGDYEVEEFDPESRDISFEIIGTRPLTLKYLLHILEC